MLAIPTVVPTSSFSYAFLEFMKRRQIVHLIVETYIFIFLVNS